MTSMSNNWIPLDELSEYPELEKVLLDEQEPNNDDWAFEFRRQNENQLRRQSVIPQYWLVLGPAMLVHWCVKHTCCNVVLVS